MSAELYSVLVASQRPLPVELQRLIFSYGLSHAKVRDELWVGLLRRSDLDASLEGDLRLRGSARVFVAWLSRPSRSLSERLAALESESRPTVLAAVAADPALPVEVFALLASRLSHKVAVALLGNPSLPREMVLPLLRFFDSDSFAAPLPKVVSEMLSARTDLHETLAASCRVRLARQLAPSEHLSSGRSLRMLELLCEDVLVRSAGLGRVPWDRATALDGLFELLEARVVAGTLPKRYARSLREKLAPATSLEFSLERFVGLLGRHLSGEGDLAALCAEARSSADPLRLEGLYSRAVSFRRSRDLSEMEVALPLLEALMGNVASPAHVLESVVMMLPASSSAAAERFGAARVEDDELFFSLLQRGRILSEVALLRMCGDPSRAHLVLDALLGRARVWELDDLARDPRFCVEWFDALSSKRLDVLLRWPVLASLVVSRLEVLLAGDAFAWEVFVGLDTFEGSLAERVVAARSV